MKWGVRNSDSTTGKEIRGARKRARKENFAITKQTVKTAVSRGEKRQAGKENLANLKMKRLMNPDQITARKMTKGEQFLLAYGLAADAARIATNPKDKNSYIAPAVKAISLAQNQREINKFKKAQGVK
jgi:pimeloyl-CoA synthetase